MKEIIERLNSIYKPLCDRANEYCNALKAAGFVATWAFYNGHFVKDGENWVEEFFPIPVLSAAGLCDIELNTESFGVTAKLKREAALAFDYKKLEGRKFEMYGVENYLVDIYNADVSENEIYDNILKSGEEEIGFSFEIANSVSVEELIHLVGFLKENGFYY